MYLEKEHIEEVQKKIKENRKYLCLLPWSNLCQQRNTECAVRVQDSRAHTLFYSSLGRRNYR